MVPLEIDGLIAAVAPVVLAVIVGLGLALDRRAGGARSLAMRVHVVDEQTHRLRGLPAYRPGAHPVGRVGPAGSKHDQGLAERELAMLDATTLAVDEDSHLEAERSTQKINRGAWVVIDGR